jgi:hypothetical protein
VIEAAIERKVKDINKRTGYGRTSSRGETVPGSMVLHKSEMTVSEQNGKVSGTALGLALSEY